MFFSFRSKLFALSVILITGFLAITGIYLHQTLGRWTQATIGSDLAARTELVSAALQELNEKEARQRFLAGLSSDDPMRVTLIARDGQVLFDSSLSEAQLGQVENHSDRPEVEAALHGEVAQATRRSTITGEETLYAALAIDEGQVVRLAVPLQEVDRLLAHLRTLLIIGGIFGLGVAIFMSSLASSLMSRTLQEVLSQSRSDEPPRPQSLRNLTEELEQTLATLAAERDRFLAVLQGMSEGIVATDAKQQITLSNPAARRLLASQSSALEDRHLRDLIPEGELATITKAIEGEGESTLEFDVTDDEAGMSPPRRVHCHASVRPGGQGMILVLHDVTTLRRLETVRRDFVANVSHELRTPVAIIQANAETLLGGALDTPEHALAFTEGIHRNAERLSRLITDLLDISRIEAGKREFQREPIPLYGAVQRAGEAAARLADSTGPALHIDIPEELVVHADPGALDQILVNLIDNAVKYSEDDGVVEVRARPFEDRLRVEVIDDGPGVAEDHRDRIFERFYRVDRGRSTQMGGTGLGLSIVKHLVVSMEGDVGYHDRDVGGSVFWFTLPIHSP